MTLDDLIEVLSEAAPRYQGRHVVAINLSYDEDDGDGRTKRKLVILRVIDAPETGQDQPDRPAGGGTRDDRR